MLISITQADIHDAIFRWYDAIDDVPPHPLPDTPKDLKFIADLFGGTNHKVERLDADGRIAEMSFVQDPKIIKTRIKQKASGKKTGNLKFDRTKAAKKAWKKRKM